MRSLDQFKNYSSNLTVLILMNLKIYNEVFQKIPEKIHKITNTLREAPTQKE